MEKNKKVFWTVFSLILAGLTSWAVFSQSRGISPADLLDNLKNSNKCWLMCAVLSVVSYILLECGAVRTILKGIGYPCPFPKSVLYTTSDIYFSAITPFASGGQPASAYFMIVDGIPVGVATAVLLLNTMMYTISIVALGIIALILNYTMFFQFRLIAKVLIALGFILLTLLACFHLSILRRGEKVFDALTRFVLFLGKKHLIRKTEKKLKKIDTAKEEFTECSKLFTGKTDLLIKAFFWNFFQRAAQIAVPVFMFLALNGKRSDAVSVFASQCLITLGFNIVPIPGAMGIADFLMIDGFQGLMGRDFAFRVEMMSRGLSFYILVLVSAVITLIGYLIIRKGSGKLPKN